MIMTVIIKATDVKSLRVSMMFAATVNCHYRPPPPRPHEILNCAETDLDNMTLAGLVLYSASNKFFSLMQLWCSVE